MSTNFPGTLDTTTQLPNSYVDATPSATVHAALHANTSDAIIAIETELGTLPKGTYTNVKTRLNDAIYKTPTADQQIKPTGDHVGLIISTDSNLNTSDFFEIKNSSGVVIAYIDHNGNLSAQGFKVAGTSLAVANLSDGTTGTGTIVLSASPALTGNPTATTQTAGNNTTRLATTAFVTAAVAAVTVPVTSVFSRTGVVVAATNDYTDLQIQNSPTNKLTATGDVLYASAANTLARLAVGSTAAALRVTGGIPSWKTLASVGGSLSNYDVPTDDFPSGGSCMLGMALSITPTSTGVIIVTITSALVNLTNANQQFTIRYGTGAAPTLEAAVTGTQAGGTVDGGSREAPCALTARISGLSVGTAYWVDVELTIPGPSPQNGNSPGLYGGSYTIVEVG